MRVSGVSTETKQRLLGSTRESTRMVTRSVEKRSLKLALEKRGSRLIPGSTIIIIAGRLATKMLGLAYRNNASAQSFSNAYHKCLFVQGVGRDHTRAKGALLWLEQLRECGTTRKQNKGLNQ